MCKRFLTIFLISVILVNLALCQVQSSDENAPALNSEDLTVFRRRKTIFVGDEFPALSIGLLNNQTEYEVRLNTSSHQCQNMYKCDMYIYLTDMTCSTANKTGKASPFLEIDRVTSTNKTLVERWCRDKASSLSEETPDFIPARWALIKPMGDWSSTSATVSILALFAENQPLRTTILSKDQPSAAITITNSSSQHNFFYEDVNDPQTGLGNASLGLRLHMTCTRDRGRNATELQLIAMLRNNQTKTVNVCSDFEPTLTDSSDIKVQDNLNGSSPSTSYNVSGYLTNIQQVYLTPVGEWPDTKTIAHIVVDTTFDSHETNADESHCAINYFDCSHIMGCDEISVPIESEYDEENTQFTSLIKDEPTNCIPINWVSDASGVDSCPLIRKYCPSIAPISEADEILYEKELNQSSTWALIFKRCIFYYAFFIIPFLMMLVMFFGTAYYIKMRHLQDALKEEERERSEQNGSRQNDIQTSRPGPRPFSKSFRETVGNFTIFTKTHKDVAYETLEDVTF